MKKISLYFMAALFLTTVSLSGCKEPAIQRTETAAEQETVSESDLSVMQSKNPDVCAILSIPGTDISFPVLRSAFDPGFCLDHDMEGQTDEKGSIYMEYYNNGDFNDPNTVIYGRNVPERFGKLHQYRDRDFFDSHRTVVVRLSDRTYTYRIFAAYSYDDRHLIATYDFWDKAVFSSWLESVFSIREMDAFIDHSAAVTSDDRIITLSTGITGQDDRRYLVHAVRTSE